MAPRMGLLVPLLTLAGSATAAAVAYRYRPRHGHGHGASAHRHRARRPTATATVTESEKTPQPTKAPVVVEAKREQERERPARSSMIIALLLQDGYMLLSLFGMCLMAMAVLVSLAVVSMNDSITSPDQLHMFSPLMLISIGLIMVGMICSMLRSPSKQYGQKRPSFTEKPAESVSVAKLEQEPTPEEDEPRVSRCPFGFG